MAADVVEFRRPANPEEPHITGQAMCTVCNHAWTAVAPIGSTHLDCPSCNRLHGVFKNAVEPDIAWACGCSGNQLFFLTRNGAMCRMCGVISSDWAN